MLWEKCAPTSSRRNREIVSFRARVRASGVSHMSFHKEDICRDAEGCIFTFVRPGGRILYLLFSTEVRLQPSVCAIFPQRVVLRQLRQRISDVLLLCGVDQQLLLLCRPVQRAFIDTVL